jgi:hypothetical protein
MQLTHALQIVGAEVQPDVVPHDSIADSLGRSILIRISHDNFQPPAIFQDKGRPHEFDYLWGPLDYRHLLHSELKRAGLRAAATVSVGARADILVGPFIATLT